jgi:hypothetical protein
LLELLGRSTGDVRVDPSRTLVQVDQALWTIVIVQQPVVEDQDAASLRRAGAKHKRVR